MVINRISKFSIYLLISYVLLIFSLNLHIHVSDAFESGSYVSFMRSVVEDGDLNIINNIDSGMGWIVSKTYNYPDMHDHGASILWAPLYAQAKVINSLVGLDPIKLQGSNIVVTFDIIVVFIMNFTMGVLGLILMRALFANYFSINPPLWTMGIVVLGSGFFNFIMYQFTSADITYFFFSSLMMYFFSLINESWRKRDFFVLGAAFAFGSVIKITSPLLVPAFFFFWFSNLKFNFFVFLKRISYFSIGSLLIYFLKETNNYIKFGFDNLDQGYSYAYTLENFLSPIPLWRPFFGPAGLFVVSPISLFSTLAFVFLMFNLILKKFKIKKEYIYFIMIGSSFIAKHFINLTVIFDGCAGFGSRQYMVDSSVIYLLVALVYNKRLEHKRLYQFGIILIILCILWTTVDYLWWLELTTYPSPNFNAYYIQDYSIVLKQFSRMLLNFFEMLKNFKLHFFANLKYVFILIIPVWVLMYGKKDFLLRDNKKSYKLFFTSCSFIVLFYSFVTAMNFYFNPRNVYKMKQEGFFVNKVVGNGPEIFIYDEYVSSIIYALDIAKLTQNREWFEYQKSVLVKLLNLSKEQILYDPIDLRSQLELGNLKKMEMDFRSTDFNSILDYNSPPAFKVWKK